MLIYIDGPEGVGKSTLADTIVEQSKRYQNIQVVRVNMRHATPARESDYHAILELATRPSMLVIMDRGWASEVVYNSLLDRPGTFTWPIISIFETMLRLYGVGVILAPPTRRRDLDIDDHRIAYAEEGKAFLDYGRANQYLLYTQDKVSPLVQANTLLEHLSEKHGLERKGAKTLV